MVIASTVFYVAFTSLEPILPSLVSRAAPEGAYRTAHRPLQRARPSLLECLSLETRLYLSAIQTGIFEFAQQDNVVLLGRGGQWLLRGISHALRLRVIAPLQQRVGRFAGDLVDHGRPATSESANQMVRHDDVNKSGRAEYLYEADIDDPDLYDLVVNMEKLGVASAVAVIESILRRPELRVTASSARLVADRGLASRVQTALTADPETRRPRFAVEAADGVVRLSGTGGLDAAIRVARRVDGVRSIESTLVESSFVPPLS